MRRRVTKQQAIQLVKRLQFLYSFLNQSSREKLIESYNKNPLRYLTDVDQLHKYLTKHDEKSEKLYFVVDDSDQYDQTVSGTVDTDEIDAAIRNIKYLIREQLEQYLKN